MNEESANPTEATGLGLVPSAGAVNRKVLTPPGTFIWPEKPRLGGFSTTWRHGACRGRLTAIIALILRPSCIHMFPAYFAIPPTP